MYFFTADEHYGHANIIKYSKRPFSSVTEMNNVLIENHNKVVKSPDVVVHVGDFTLNDKKYACEIIKKLNGSHIFLIGSHDRWLKNALQIWEKTIEGIHLVACHYSMRVWPRSHYGSWQIYGHSHGNLDSIGKQYDVGVDNNNYYPISFDQLRIIMENKEDNFNLIKT